MITRDILNYHNTVIGSVSFPDNTPESVIQEVLATYAQPPASAATTISNIVLSARAFGTQLMSEFAAENVLMGLTEDQMDQCLDLLQPILIAFGAGSLKIAIRRINTIVPDGVVLTDARIKKYRNKIEDYLGIAQT
jgi:hypothetical protein